MPLSQSQALFRGILWLRLPRVLMWGVTGMRLTELVRECVGEQPVSTMLRRSRQGRESSL